MKFLGNIVGLMVAVVIWVGSYFLVGSIFDHVPENYKNEGVAVGLVALTAAVIGGRKAWKLTVLRVEDFGRYWARRRAARQSAVVRSMREESQKHADEKFLRSSLEKRMESSHEVAQSLPALIVACERALDQAEEHFTAGLFVPFWDAMEGAVNKLATYNANLELLAANARNYNKEGSRLDPLPPAFTLGIPGLPDAGPVAERLRAIVEWSHRNHEFSGLYELRKYNRLRAAGFSNLGDAIAQMTTRLADSSKELMDVLNTRAKEGSAISAMVQESR